MKKRKILLLLIVLVAVVGGIVAYRMLTDRTAEGNVSQPLVSVSTAEPETWQTHLGEKLSNSSYNSYRIQYPPDWNKKVTESEISSGLTLSKGSYQISVGQKPIGGAECVYDKNFPEGESIFIDLSEAPYVELTTGIGVLRRTNFPTSEYSFAFCHGVPLPGGYLSFGVPTLVGSIIYKLPQSYDPAILAEMDKIIETLQYQ
ncbi:hypothetical protein HY478_01100 [Candidatus Uhrbacteria bacterium]|nr:hypothetical protein [Candidatus Uhrbacteria bacterium]